MAADHYQIIDEPKPSRWAKFIVNPVAILLVAMLLPLMWTPPLAGRYWMPLLWLLVNGFILGSASWKKELIFSIVGGLAMLVCVYGALFYFQQFDPEGLPQAAPYIRIVLNGVLFLSLYLVVFTQSTSYQLYQYIHQQR